MIHKVPPLFIRIAEVLILGAIMYGGTREIINNLRTDVSELKYTVGTTRSDKSLCERATISETQYSAMKDDVTEIKKDVKTLLKRGG